MKIVKRYKRYLYYNDIRIGKYAWWPPEGRFANQKYLGFAIYNNDAQLIVGGYLGGINYFLRRVNSQQEAKIRLLECIQKGKRFYL